MTLEQHTGNYLLQPRRYCCLFINPWELFWWKSLWIMLIERLRLCRLLLERRQEFDISSSWGGQWVATWPWRWVWVFLGLGLAGITGLGAGWVLGQVPWDAGRGDGHWITQHSAEFRVFPMEFWISSGPDRHSPTHCPADPHQTQIQLLHATSAPKSCSDLPLSNYFVLWELSWSFSKGDAHSPKHTQGAAPQTPSFLCVFTLCTHWWCWLKVVVMETPFSLSANSAGFLSTASICERASFSCSPFKITIAIGNIWGV